MQWEVLLAIHVDAFWMDELLDMDAWTRSTLKGDEFQGVQIQTKHGCHNNNIDKKHRLFANKIICVFVKCLLL